MTRTLADARARLAEALQAFSAAQSSVPTLQAAIAAGRTPGNDELAGLYAVRPALDVAARAMGLDPEGATLADLEARLAAWEEAVALRRRLMRLAQATGPAIITPQLAELAAEAGRLAVAQAWSPEEAARAEALGRLVELADAATSNGDEDQILSLDSDLRRSLGPSAAPVVLAASRGRLVVPPYPFKTDGPPGGQPPGSGPPPRPPAPESSDAPRPIGNGRVKETAPLSGRGQRTVAPAAVPLEPRPPRPIGPADTGQRGGMRTLARFSFRHRWLVVAVWLVALVGITLLTRAVGTGYSNSFTLPKTESTRAIELLQAAQPRQAGDVDQIVLATSGGARVTDPDVEAKVTAMLARVAALPHVTNVRSPYSPQGARQINADGTVGFAAITYDVQAQNLPIADAKSLVKTATGAGGGTLQVAVGGQVAESATPPSPGGSGFGILAAGIVLFLVFGSLLAALMPLASALVSLGTAIGVIGLLSNALKMPQFSTELVALIGLGVGVDYALFIISRHRQGLLRGEQVEASVLTAVDTSGRAVLFAGIVVCIALLGMFALRVSFLYGLAVAASIGVLFTMVAALTLLPALLGFLGPKVLSRRQRAKLARTGPVIGHAGGFWDRWATIVQRRPAIWAVLALVVIGALALPFFSLRLGSSDAGSDPAGTTTRQAYDLLAKGFGPGFNGPLAISVEMGGTNPTAALQTLVSALKATPDIAAVIPSPPIPVPQGPELAIIQAYPASAPQAAATTDLIAHLRTQVIPRATAGTGITVYVGGLTAIFVDFSNVLTSKLPLFIAVVVGLSFILLAIVFRSLLIPLKAAIMNLLSVGAAFGVLVAVFQWGWLGKVFGVTRTGPVTSFLPVMLFAILFGLSMDYEVFLLTRVHEEYLRTGDNSDGVRIGLAATGQTITAAAAIMIVVFGSFILLGQPIIKEFGLGLATAILVDAVVVRSALVPALMQMLGKANWWFPRWLDRLLPHLHVESEEPEEIPDLRPEAEPVPALT
ncbi:MAG TPA: MMPL family transporter, partial [Actinomycetota bacterium]|nr:MMPL family transporter [Actinomycetota bacterium]